MADPNFQTPQTNPFGLSNESHGCSPKPNFVNIDGGWGCQMNQI